MEGGVHLAGLTCHAPLQCCLYENMPTARAEGEKDRRDRWKREEDIQRYKGDDGGAIEKTDSHAPHFPSQEQGEQEGEKSELYFFGCLEQAQRSSSTRTQCNKTLRDEVSDSWRQGKERRKRRK